MSANARDFISKCMTTDFTKRPTAIQLLKHPWMSEVVIDADLLDSTQDLRKYIAKLRLRAGIQTVAVALRMANINEYIKDLE